MARARGASCFDFRTLPDIGLLFFRFRFDTVWIRFWICIFRLLRRPVNRVRPRAGHKSSPNRYAVLLLFERAYTIPPSCASYVSRDPREIDRSAEGKTRRRLPKFPIRSDPRKPYNYNVRPESYYTRRYATARAPTPTTLPFPYTSPSLPETRTFPGFPVR